jgi:hypothetical protein
MAEILSSLAAELERPRPLTRQVIHHLAGTYGLERDQLGAFLERELAGLEDYEVDLILSPLFTPGLQDQAVFAGLLGAESVPAAEWPALIQQLAARPTQARLVTEDDRTHAVPLREVTIERYVRRLRLDATVPPPLLNLLAHLAPAGDRPLLTAVARRAVWDPEPRRQLLVRYLTTALSAERYQIDDVLALLKLAETYEPADLDDFLSRIPHWERVLRHEINLAASPKAFFNERVQELHGGGRDQRRQDNARIDDKQRELAFLERLKTVLTQTELQPGTRRF